MQSQRLGLLFTDLAGPARIGRQRTLIEVGRVAPLRQPAGLASASARPTPPDPRPTGDCRRWLDLQMGQPVERDPPGSVSGSPSLSRCAMSPSVKDRFDEVVERHRGLASATCIDRDTRRRTARSIAADVAIDELGGEQVVRIFAQGLAAGVDRGLQGLVETVGPAAALDARSRGDFRPRAGIAGGQLVGDFGGGRPPCSPRPVRQQAPSASSPPGSGRLRLTGWAIPRCGPPLRPNLAAAAVAGLTRYMEQHDAGYNPPPTIGVR